MNLYRWGFGPHWLCHFYWIAHFIYRLPLYERYVVLLSLFVLLEAEMYIGISGWLFMAKCHSNNFNVSKGLVQSAQTEPWKWSIVPAKVIHYIFTISILSRAELLCYGDLLPPLHKGAFHADAIVCVPPQTGCVSQSHEQSSVCFETLAAQECWGKTFSFKSFLSTDWIINSALRGSGVGPRINNNTMEQ